MSRCHEDHPLAENDTVDMKALDAEPWIAGRAGSFCHLVVIHSTRAAGYEPRLAHITNDFDVSYALVQAGAGVGLVPELAGPPPPGVVVRPIKGSPAEPQDLRRRARGQRRPARGRRNAGGAHRSRIARSISRFISRSLIVWRLSPTSLPFASAISALTRPSRK